MTAKRDEQQGFLQFDIENLERRRMLAGNVTSSLVNGSLNISGDSQDNILAVVQVNGEFAVIGVDTSIEDADFSTNVLGIDVDIKLIDGVTKDIVAILRGGDDTFLFGGAAEEVDPDDLLVSDNLTFGPANLGRDLKIFTNGGRDTVVVTGAEVGRDIRIDTGFGLEDVIAIGGGGVAMGILDLVEAIEPATPSGALQGDGLSGFALDLVNAIVGSVDIGRDLYISGESSHDTVYVGGASIGRDAKIFTNIGEDVVHFGTGAIIEVLFVDDAPVSDDLSIDEILNFLDQVEVSAFVSVGRNANIQTGDGDDVATIGGDTNYLLGPFGFDPEDATRPRFVEIFTFEIDGGVAVENNFTLNVANHDDSAYIGVGPRFNFDGVPETLLDNHGEGEYDVYVGRDMILLTAGDDDFLQIGGTQGKVVGPCLDPMYDGVLLVERNLTIDTGAGTDDVILGETEPVMVLDGTGLLNEDLTFYQIDIGNNLTINTGMHDDNVTIAGYPVFWQGVECVVMTSVGNLHVGRNLRANTDGGNDNFFMGYSAFDPDEVVVLDSNNLDEDDSTAVLIEGDLVLLTGDQDGDVTIDSTHVGDDATIRTGWGRDSLSIGTDRSVWIGDRLTVDTSLERDTIDMTNSFVGGNALFNTGLRDDNLSITNSEFGGNLTANTGRGNDVVVIREVSVDGNLRVNTAAENDQVEIFETTASLLFVIAGANDDHVCVFDSIFTGGATLNGGSGDADAVGENLASPTVINFEEIADCGVELT